MYDITQFKADLFNCMKSRPNGGVYSGRALGNTENIKLWNDKLIERFYSGIVTAHNLFHFEHELIDFARLVICECMQESTGNYRLGCKKVDFSDHTSHGIIQVTPGSVLKDYRDWGVPIMDVSGAMILSPSLTHEIDTTDPKVSVIIWAWYTKNCVNATMSLAEYFNRDLWNLAPRDITQTYQTAMLTWLSGPSNCAVKNFASFKDYYLRILDYYTQSGFGNKETFDKLLSTKLQGGMIGVMSGRNQKFQNRDTCCGINKINIRK
jgi:hypothetical protein